MFEDYEFALCLTHDVDRTNEGFQGLYYALKDRDPSRLQSVLPTRDSYWQFDSIMRLEESLGVRSAFYFLVEKELFKDFPPRKWLSPQNWILYRGRYDINANEIVDAIRQLDDLGWEIGLHGSFGSFDSPERLRYEASTIESIVGHELQGGRQHYLNLEIPDTWHHHAAAGLTYDTTIGSSQGYGFDQGYSLLQPFDGFVVFPLTLMDIALPEVATNPQRAWHECEQLLEEAQENGAVMTVDWHQRCFSDTAFPHHRDIYRALIEQAQEMGAWVGSPGEFLAELETRPDCFQEMTVSTDTVTMTPSG